MSTQEYCLHLLFGITICCCCCYSFPTHWSVHWRYIVVGGICCAVDMFVCCTFLPSIWFISFHSYSVLCICWWFCLFGVVIIQAICWWPIIILIFILTFVDWFDICYLFTFHWWPFWHMTDPFLHLLVHSIHSVYCIYLLCSPFTFYSCPFCWYIVTSHPFVPTPSLLIHLLSLLIVNDLLMTCCWCDDAVFYLHYDLLLVMIHIPIYSLTTHIWLPFNLMTLMTTFDIRWFQMTPTIQFVFTFHCWAPIPYQLWMTQPTWLILFGGIDDYYSVHLTSTLLLMICYSPWHCCPWHWYYLMMAPMVMWFLFHSQFGLDFFDSFLIFLPPTLFGWFFWFLPVLHSFLLLGLILRFTLRFRFSLFHLFTFVTHLLFIPLLIWPTFTFTFSLFVITPC